MYKRNSAQLSTEVSTRWSKLCRQHFQMYFRERKCAYSDSFVHNGPVDNKAARKCLGTRTGDKPLPDPRYLIPYIVDRYIYPYAVLTCLFIFYFLVWVFFFSFYDPDHIYIVCGGLTPIVTQCFEIRANGKPFYTQQPCLLLLSYAFGHQLDERLFHWQPPTIYIVYL